MATLEKLKQALTVAEDRGLTEDANFLRQRIFEKESKSSFGGGLARSAGQGLTFGFGDEIVAGVKAPFTDRTYQEELALERAKLEDFRRTNPKTALASEIAGSFAIPFAGGIGRGITKGIQKAGEVVGRKTGQLGNLATQGAIGGGAYGVGTSEGDSTLSDALKSASVGAVASPVIGRTVQKILNPKVSPDAKILMDEGVKLTAGQKLGGSRLENALTSFPVFGGGLRKSYEQGIDSFNRATINKALKPINKKLPDDVDTGTSAIVYLDDQIGTAYKATVPNANIRIDEDFMIGLANLEELMSTTTRLEPFKKYINNNVLKIIKDGNISGDDYKQLYSNLGKEIKKFKFGEPDVMTQREALVGLRDLITDNLKKQNPEIAKELSKIDSSYNLAKRIIDASAKAKEDGIFRPNQLLDSIKKQDFSKDKRRFARGEASGLQDFAKSAQRILPSKVPDSGTTERLANVALAGGIPVSPFLTGIDPVGAGLIGGGLLGLRQLVSPAGQPILSGIFTQRPQFIRNIGQGVETASPFITGSLINR